MVIPSMSALPRPSTASCMPNAGPTAVGSLWTRPRGADLGRARLSVHWRAVRPRGSAPHAGTLPGRAAGVSGRIRQANCGCVLDRTLHEQILLPTNPFTKAAQYALAREAALQVFLEYPNVPPDTNHLEREIRAIAMGRKAWLFCWTEVGARYVGIMQSLIASCRPQRVDLYVYLVDVLQRIDTHPAFDVHLLTPRLWKQHFVANPLRSDLDRRRH